MPQSDSHLSTEVVRADRRAFLLKLAFLMAAVGGGAAATGAAANSYRLPPRQCASLTAVLEEAGTVLLKNSGSTLPLKASGGGSVAVIGPAAPVVGQVELTALVTAIPQMLRPVAVEMLVTAQTLAGTE